MKTKVYYADTDAAGVVYYGNYLRWLEMARSDWLDQWGVPLADYANQGVLFSVVRVEIDYLSPAVLGDDVEITVVPQRVRRVRFLLRQDVIRVSDRRTLATANVTLACLAPEGRAVPVPPRLAEVMSEKLEQGQEAT